MVFEIINKCVFFFERLSNSPRQCCHQRQNLESKTGHPGAWRGRMSIQSGESLLRCTNAVARTVYRTAFGGADGSDGVGGGSFIDVAMAVAVTMVVTVSRGVGSCNLDGGVSCGGSGGGNVYGGGDAACSDDASVNGGGDLWWQGLC